MNKEVINIIKSTMTTSGNTDCSKEKANIYCKFKVRKYIEFQGCEMTSKKE